MLTREQVRQHEELRRAEHQWTERLQKLVKDLEGRDNSAQAPVVWERLRSISDPAAIPALEVVIAPCNERLGLEVVALLGQMRSHLAADSLIRLSDSRLEAVRMAAVSQLSGSLFIRPFLGCWPAWDGRSNLNTT